MKKPWTLATTNAIVARDVVRTCDGTHKHAIARGKDCKCAEDYTIEFAKHVHVMLKHASTSSCNMVVPLFIDACPAVPIAGCVSNAIQGSVPVCVPTIFSPPPSLLFSSALFLSQSLAQVRPASIRQEPSLHCCATTTARGEYDMSPFIDCHELYSDNVVECRRGVAQNTATQHSGLTAVLGGDKSIAPHHSGLTTDVGGGKSIAPHGGGLTTAVWEFILSRFPGLRQKEAKKLVTGCVGSAQIMMPDTSEAPLAGSRTAPCPPVGQASQNDQGRTPPPPPPGRPGGRDHGASYSRDSPCR